MTYFSVIIPCFNAAETLPQTLDSLRAQTYLGWEAICIDDGSTDDTQAVVERYAAMDERIKLVRNTGNGPSCARNMVGMEWTANDVLAFCDADDIWAPTKLAQLHCCFHDKSVDAAYGKIAFFSEEPNDARTQSSVPDNDLKVPMLLAENPVCTMSNIAVRRTAFMRTGGFNETLVTIVSFGVLCIVTYLLFLFGDRIVKAVGPSALSVVTKMMGLILAVIGVQMLLEGIAEAIKTGFF